MQNKKKTLESQMRNLKSQRKKNIRYNNVYDMFWHMVGGYGCDTHTHTHTQKHL